MSEETKNIIIKKINKADHGHHGGAWKVAYADFVTAMMAFFLLMWLLNATEAEQLAGLADYFAPTTGVSGEMGIGFRGGKAAISDGIGADINTNKGIVFGGVPTGPIVKVTEKIDIKTEEQDDEKVVVITGVESIDEEAQKESDSFASAESQLQDFVKGIDSSTGLNEVIDIKQTLEGLQIQIKDSQAGSMFIEDTAEIAPRIQKLLEKVSLVVKSLPNYVSITGHSSPLLTSNDPDKTHWELSAARANSVRKFLLQQGVQADRFNRIIGKADNDPLDPRRPHRAINNRIDIVLLKSALLPHHKQVAPEGVFLDPDSKEAKQLLETEKN